jgi:dsRNA-specific ribonuclease
LEFLGDSVLQLVVSRYLFNRFPEYFEGQLSLVIVKVKHSNLNLE